MKDKQIIIDYENLCANYSKEVGCYNTFDGSCIKEQCFTYRLLQLLKAKEQECEKYKQTLTEIKPILEFYANSNIGEEQPDKTYHIILNGSYIMFYDPKPARQALQKISECEVENAR